MERVEDKLSKGKRMGGGKGEPEVLKVRKR